MPLRRPRPVRSTTCRSALQSAAHRRPRSRGSWPCFRVCCDRATFLNVDDAPRTHGTNKGPHRLRVRAERNAGDPTDADLRAKRKRFESTERSHESTSAAVLQEATRSRCAPFNRTEGNHDSHLLLFHLRNTSGVWCLLTSCPFDISGSKGDDRSRFFRRGSDIECAVGNGTHNKRTDPGAHCTRPGHEGRVLRQGNLSRQLGSNPAKPSRSTGWQERLERLRPGPFLPHEREWFDPSLRLQVCNRLSGAVACRGNRAPQDSPARRAVTAGPFPRAEDRLRGA